MSKKVVKNREEGRGKKLNSSLLEKRGKLEKSLLVVEVSRAMKEVKEKFRKKGKKRGSAERTRSSCVTLN